jgi:hypothetical protein
MEAVLHTFKSRYGDERRLIRVDESTLLVEGPSIYTRGSTDGEQNVIADFEGGPFIMRGMSVQQATGYPMTALIESVRFLPHDKPGHARCEVRIKSDQQS